MSQENQKLRALLDEYGRSHQHPGNHRLHLFCVPAIMLSIFGMSDSAPLPFSLAYLLAGFGLLYYLQFRNLRVYGVLLAELIPMLALVILTRGEFSIGGTGSRSSWWPGSANLLATSWKERSPPSFRISSFFSSARSGSFAASCASKPRGRSALRRRTPGSRSRCQIP